ncbi:MAG: sulfotransferase [Nocardioidaceae bacterium]
MTDPSAASEPLSVLFVGGMPRSGSTLFDLMVGQLPGHCDVGELFYMWQAGPLRDQRCACGVAFSECPFWSEVGDRAFDGWENVDAAEVLALQSQVDSTAQMFLARLLPRRSARAAGVRRYLDLTVAVYRAVADVTGARVVVDSTKRPSTAYLLAGEPRVDLAVAHVVRDPRGVLNSWSREVPLPEDSGARSHLKRRAMRQVVRRWVTVNTMIGRLSGCGVPILLVRYEDLVDDPVPVMESVLRLTGAEPVAGDLDFIGPEGVHTGVSHAASGGRVRFRTGPMPLKLDEAWRRELPRWKQVVTSTVCKPLMGRYGYR